MDTVVPLVFEPGPAEGNARLQDVQEEGLAEGNGVVPFDLAEMSLTSPWCHTERA